MIHGIQSGLWKCPLKYFECVSNTLTTVPHVLYRVSWCIFDKNLGIFRKSVNFNFLVAALDGGGDVVNDDHDDMERPIPPPPGLVLRATKPVVATNHSSLPTTCLSAFDF